MTTKQQKSNRSIFVSNANQKGVYIAKTPPIVTPVVRPVETVVPIIGLIDFVKRVWAENSKNVHLSRMKREGKSTVRVKQKENAHWRVRKMDVVENLFAHIVPMGRLSK